MSAGGPSKYCPRCDSALPLRAPYCETCGYQFYFAPGSAPQATPYGSNYGLAPYGGPTTSERWPLSQPEYPYQGQPGYDYPYGPGAPLPPRSNAGKIIALVLMLVVLVGSGTAAWFLYLSPSHPNSPFRQEATTPPFDRHGVPDSVPLPDGLTFVTTDSMSQTNPRTHVTATLDDWEWKVAGSDPAEIAEFYRGQMPGKGWASIRSQTATNGDQEVIGCQATQVLLIGATSHSLPLKNAQGTPGPTVIPPAGGSVLVILLVTTNNQQAAKSVCAAVL